MNPVSGEIVGMVEEDGVRKATVSVRGARMNVVLSLLDDVSIGDVVLIVAGVAIAKVQPQPTDE